MSSRCCLPNLKPFSSTAVVRSSAKGRLTAEFVAWFWKFFPSQPSCVYNDMDSFYSNIRILYISTAFRGFFPSACRTLVLLVWLCCPKLFFACASLWLCLTYLPVSAVTSITPSPSPPPSSPSTAAAVVPPSSYVHLCTVCPQYAILVCFSDNCNQSCRFCYQTNWLYSQASAPKFLCIPTGILGSPTLVQSIEMVQKPLFCLTSHQLSEENLG